MNIAEMHVAFRQYAQQMGMQNVRAILPEQIDVLLNQSITDTINQLIRENIGVTSDRIISDNSQIGQINALRTLYEVREVDIAIGSTFTYDATNRLQGLIKHVGSDNDPETEDPVFGKYMFIVDISINYTSVGSGETITTAWYPVRIVESSKLADILNDFVLKNRFRTPVACLYMNDTLELYIEKFKADSTPTIEVKSGVNTINLTPNKLRIDIIKRPGKVKYVEDISEGASVDCDLPENIHGDIVKHAVDMYRISVSGQLQTQQSTQQPQQQAVQE